MPRKRAVKVGSVPDGGGVTVTVAPESQPENVVSSAEAESTDEIEQATETEPTRAEARIHRIDELNGTKLYVGVVSPSLVSHRWIMQTLGGGKYPVSFWKVKGATRNLVYDKTIIYEIDPTIPRKVPPWARVAEDEAMSGPVTNGTPSGSGASLLESQLVSLFTMQQQAFKESTEAARADRQMQNTMLQAWLERMAAGSKPSIDWAALLPTLGPLVIKMITERRDPVEIARELTETIAKANARQPEPPSALTDALALMDRIENRVRRNTSAAPAADPADDSIFGFLKSTAPDLLRLYEKQLDVRADLVRRGLVPATGAPPSGAAPPANGQPSLPPAAPAPTMYVPPEAVASAAGVTPSAVVTSPVTDPSMPIWAPFLKPFVGEFLDYAKRGKDPKACADLLLTRLELNDQLEVAAPLIDDSTFGAQFVKAFPEFSPYAVWVEMMLQAGREDLSQTDDDGRENEGE
jgi:hypothetical protein